MRQYFALRAEYIKLLLKVRVYNFNDAIKDTCMKCSN